MVTSHGLRGSASPVLTATGFVNVNYISKHRLRISNYTGLSGLTTCHLKFGIDLLHRKDSFMK